MASVQYQTSNNGLISDILNKRFTEGPDKRYEVQIRDGFDAFRVAWYQQVRFYMIIFFIYLFISDLLILLSIRLVATYMI